LVEPPRPDDKTPIPAPAPADEPIHEAEALGVEEIIEVSSPPGEVEVVADDEVQEVSELDIREVTAPPPAPPAASQVDRRLPSKRPVQPPSLDGRPSKATTEFWLHTFQSLELLPGEMGRSSRILACETRAERSG
jgi:hypothetical protein